MTQPFKPGIDLPRLKVISNGLPHNTLVLLDGKPIEICELHLSVTANDFVRATLVFEAALDIDANVDLGKIPAPSISAHEQASV